jgi:hypothetical protein
MWRLGSWQILLTFPESRIFSSKSTPEKSHCLSGQNLSKKGKHKILPRKHHCLGSWLREKMRECQFLGKIRETQILTEKLTADDTGSYWQCRVLDARRLGSWLKLLTFPVSRIFSRNQLPRIVVKRLCTSIAGNEWESGELITRRDAVTRELTKFINLSRISHLFPYSTPEIFVQSPLKLVTGEKMRFSGSWLLEEMRRLGSW